MDIAEVESIQKYFYFSHYSFFPCLILFVYFTGSLNAVDQPKNWKFAVKRASNYPPLSTWESLLLQNREFLDTQVLHMNSHLAKNFLKKLCGNW